MEVLQISSQFYVVRHEEDGTMTIIDGPYPERYQAMSMARVREID